MVDTEAGGGLSLQSRLIGIISRLCGLGALNLRLGEFCLK